MKTLYLARHAKSSWDNLGLADFDRPLNNRGRKNAPMMGEYLKKSGVEFDFIVSSPALRALTTAKEIANKFDYKTENIVTNRKIYGANAFELIDIIQNLDNNFNKIMLFGHNPAITRVANELANLNISNVPTCGVVTIVFSLNTWRDISSHTGKLLNFDYPKKIK